MTVINFSNSLSTINFCDKRLNPKLANEVMAKYEAGCLAPEKSEYYKTLAIAGDYIRVLGAVWKDKENRLTFLRELAPQFHAPLMFEQAIAEFVANPTAETVNLVSVPLLKAAIFRVRQDTQCSTDSSVVHGDADMRLQLIYVPSLENAIKKYLGKTLADVQKDFALERQKAMGEKITEVARESMTINLPSPNWIGQHGMSIFLSGSISMHPESEYKRIRDDFAKKIITELSPK